MVDTTAVVPVMEAARYTGIGPRTIYRWAKDHEIWSKSKDRTIFVRLGEVEARRAQRAEEATLGSAAQAAAARTITVPARDVPVKADRLPSSLDGARIKAKQELDRIAAEREAIQKRLILLQRQAEEQLELLAVRESEIQDGLDAIVKVARMLNDL